MLYCYRGGKQYDHKKQHYFKQKKPSNAKRPVIRFETPAGKQAQLDWKENIPFLLKSGETITINVLVLLLSYSRFRVYRLSLSKTQDVLFSLLNDALETFGGQVIIQIFRIV